MAVGKQQSEVQYQEVHTMRKIWVAAEINVGTLLYIFKTGTKTQVG